MYRLCKRRRTLAPNTCSTTVGDDDVTGANAMLRDSIDSIDAGVYGEGFRSINELMRSRANAWVNPGTAANLLSSSEVIDDTAYGESMMRLNELLRSWASSRGNHGNAEHVLANSVVDDDTA